MPENLKTFYIEDENGKRTTLDRMTRAECEEVICSMVEEIAYLRRLEAIVAAEDASGATIQ